MNVLDLIDRTERAGQRIHLWRNHMIYRNPWEFRQRPNFLFQKQETPNAASTEKWRNGHFNWTIKQQLHTHLQQKASETMSHLGKRPRGRHDHIIILVVNKNGRGRHTPNCRIRRHCFTRPRVRFPHHTSSASSPTRRLPHLRLPAPLNHGSHPMLSYTPPKPPQTLENLLAPALHSPPTPNAPSPTQFTPTTLNPTQINAKFSLTNESPLQRKFLKSPQPRDGNSDNSRGKLLVWENRISR